MVSLTIPSVLPTKALSHLFGSAKFTGVALASVDLCHKQISMEQTLHQSLLVAI